MTDYNYIWIRFRTCHSASYGSWMWDEFPYPIESTTWSRNQKERYFLDHFVSLLNDQYDTETEHWRGIEFEFVPVPYHIVAKKLEELKDEHAKLSEQIKRFNTQLPNLPKVNLTETKTCLRWPRCGCIKQNKHKDCRPPIDLNKNGG